MSSMHVFKKGQIAVCLKKDYTFNVGDKKRIDRGCKVGTEYIAIEDWECLASDWIPLEVYEREIALSSVVKVGSTVKMINPNPHFGIGRVKVGDIGKVRDVQPSSKRWGRIQVYVIDFPNDQEWHGTFEDIVLYSSESISFVPLVDQVSATSVQKEVKKDLTPVSGEITTKTKEKEAKPMAKDTITDRVTTAGKKVAAAQTAMAKTAATLEAARIFNNQLAKVATKHAPLMVKGYVATPIGRAIMANLILVGIETTLPGITEDDIRKQVVRAAVVESYGTLMQTFKLEDMLNELFEMPALKSVTGAIGLSEED